MNDEASNPNCIETVRLKASLSKCGLAPKLGDLEPFATRTSWAITEFQVFAEMESAGRADAEKGWVRSVHDHASELLKLLSAPPRLAEASMPLDAMAPLAALADAAERQLDSFGSPSAPKQVGNSPMQRLIKELAPIFDELTGQKARVTRANMEGAKGGAFFDFVRAVAEQWNFRPPSVEAIAKALRDT